MRRLILIPLLVVVVLLAIVAGVGYWIYNGYYYYSTDDAQVHGNLVSIASTGNGQLATFTPQVGTQVTAGDVIGTIDEVSPTTGKPMTVKLTSPITGTIVQDNAVEGQTVSAGLMLAQVTNLNSVNIEAFVDESAINNVKLNQTVDVSIDAYKNTTYTGHIQQIVQSTAGQFSLIPTE
ncbi:MAG TPA: efflux RND transporter periplasmic adaptor subunit, partial [Ktedonobacteraceae bacterium]|nr:efflux RND transporter periplasmic adaptor subunit [Ktedonobacteraceae bacterium]